MGEEIGEVSRSAILSAGSSATACPLFLVCCDGIPFAAYPRRLQAEVYASGFRNQTTIVEGTFTANAESEVSS